MKEFIYKKIDAFAIGASACNPAGYIALNSFDDISVEEMEAIAKQQKGFVNEVGFVEQTGDNSFKLKYYSSEREVDFCGHATIAIMYDLAKNNASLQSFDTLQISTNRGVLKVENRIKSEDSVFIMSPEPYYVNAVPLAQEIADNLGTNLDEISSESPIQVINAGLTTLIVPIKRLTTILNLYPNIDQLKAFCVQNDIDIIEVYCNQTSNSKSDYRVRVFAPLFGYLEDPATGSGNSAFGYYLIKNFSWVDGTIVIEQNGLADNYNVVKLQQQSDEKNHKRVLFGGSAVTRIEGKYFI